MGRPSEALRRWRSAVDTAERLSMPYEAALARLEIGRHLDAGDPGRPSHLEAALGIFRRLGAARDAGRVEREIGSDSRPAAT